VNNFGFLLRLAALVICLAPLWVRSAVLDWDKLTWTPGSLTNTYYATNTANPTGYFYKDDDNSGVASITIWISGNVNRLTNDPSGPMTPFLQSNSPSGGLSPREMNLKTYLDFASTNEYITINISFNYFFGVSNVTLRIFDVDTHTDLHSFVDQIRNVTGTYSGYSVGVPVNAVGSPANTVTSNNTRFVTITGTNEAAQTTTNGNVTLNFGTNVIHNIRFDYGSGPGAIANPAVQSIALYDIVFYPRPRVPEIGAGWIAGAGCLLLMGWHGIRARLRMKHRLEP